ncbi:MAG: DUF3109 family protein [Saprospiraceae bacterium]
MIIIQDVLVSDDIGAQKFMCDVVKCKGACCVQGDYGAPLEKEEMKIIEENLTNIIPFLPKRSQDYLSQFKGYEYHLEAQKDVTACHDDGTCVFAQISSEGIVSCGIEMGYRQGATTFIKPISCHLYPIRISRNDIMGFEAWNYDEWDICKPACEKGCAVSLPMYVFLKNAIIRAKGEDFYEELCAVMQYTFPEKS